MVPARRTTFSRRWLAGVLAALLAAAALPLLVWPHAAQAAPPAPTPVVTLSLPGSGLIGQPLSFTVGFSNQAGSDTGYGPYVDLVVAPGADGDDGLTVTGATYLGSPVNRTAKPCTGAPVTHPLTGLPTPCPAGSTLVVLELPFGSVVAGQPEKMLQVQASLSTLADLGVALPVQAQGGFRYGALATGGTPITGTSVTRSLTPSLATMAIADNTPEGETATGPNYPHTWTSTVDAAAGQTLRDVTLTVALPDDAVYLGIDPATTPAYVVVSQPAANTTALSGSSVTVRFPTVNATAATDDAKLVLRWYTPQLDAAGGAILNPVTGAWDSSTTSVSGTYAWTPVDPRDPPVTGAVLRTAGGATTANSTHTNKPVAVQKAVADITGGPTVPSHRLRYTISSQVSDYVSVDALRLSRDLVSDGQSVQTVPAPTWSATDRTGAQSGTFPTGTATFPGTPNSCTVANPGDVPLDFDLAGARSAGGGPARFTGGRIGPDAGPATATVVFETVIDARYRCQDTGFNGELALNQGDTVRNRVAVDATIVSATPTAAPQDTSATTTQVAQGRTSKEIVAIDGVAVTAGATPTRVTVGSKITYRLTEDFVTTNFEALTLTDFLPTPPLRASEVTVFDGAGGALPAPGHWGYGPGDTYHSLPAATTPSLTRDTGRNALVFDFGNRDTDTTGSMTVQLQFTVTVGNTPFIDGLYLTNELESRQGDTTGAVEARQAIIQFEINEPALAIRKGVVATDRSGGATPPPVFTPTTTAPAGVTFAVGTPGFTGGTISSATLGTTLDADLAKVDAADRVLFAVVLENRGRGRYGAYDVTFADVCPTGYDCTAAQDFSITDGAGTPLPAVNAASATAATAQGLFSATGIRLTDPGFVEGTDGGGSLANCKLSPTGQPCARTDGKNLAIITYSLPIAGSTAPNTTLTSSATVLRYTNTQGTYPDGTPPANFVPADGLPDFDAASVTTTGITLTKALTGTDQPHTTGANVTIGEQATYTVTAVIPQGSTPNAVLGDTLPGGLAFQGAATITCSAGVTASGCGTSPAISGSSFSLPLGTVTNANTDNSTADTITVTYAARVADVAASQDGQTKTNAAVFSYTGGSASASTSVTVVEPTLAVTSGSSPAQVDAGDTVTLTVTVKNATPTSDRTAYDAELQDTLPAQLDQVAITGTSGCPTGPVAVSGNQLTGSWDTFGPTTTCVITLTARVVPGSALGDTIPTQADVTWTSLPGTDSGERTGSFAGPLVGTAPTGDYHSRSVGAVGVRAATLAKVLFDTSEPSTTGSNLTIGEVATYRVTVSLPEGNLSGVALTDTLPAGMSYLPGSASVVSQDAGISPNPLTFSVSGGTGVGVPVTMNFGAVSVDSTSGTTANTLTVALLAGVADVAGNKGAPPTPLSNSATLAVSGRANVTSPAVTAQVVEPRLTLTKVLAPKPAARGDVVTVTVTAKNTGTSTAFEPVVSDPLPAQLSFTALGTTPAGWTADSTGGRVTYTADAATTLAPNATATFTFTATVTGGSAGTVVSNTAYAGTTSLPGNAAVERGKSPNTGQPGPAGGAYGVTGADSFTESAPDVRVRIDDGVTTFSPGGTLTYDVRVDNVGARTATGTVATATVPPNTTFSSAPANTAGGQTCPAGVLSGSTVTWAVGTVGPNSTQTVTCRLVLTVATPLVAGDTSIATRADVAEDGTHGVDPDLTNNTATDTDTRNPAAVPVLAITKTDGATSALPGQTVTYTITVTNTGSVQATGVPVTDVLDSATTFLSASGGGTLSGSTVSWPAQDLPGGGAQRVETVTVGVADPMPAGKTGVTDTARASATNIGSGPGSVATPVSATDTDTVASSPVLTLSINDGTQLRQAGDRYTYTTTVANTGNQVAAGTVITVTLPPGLSCLAPGAPSSTTTPGGTCDNVARTVSWTRGPLSPTDGAVAYLATVRVDNPLAESVSSFLTPARITATNATTANDTDTDAAARVDLAVTVTDGRTAVTPGSTSTYQVVATNTGNLATTTATATLTLPAGVTVTAAGGATVTPTGGGTTLTWTGVSLAAGGGTRSFTVVTTVDDPQAAGVSSIAALAQVSDPQEPATRVGPENTATDTDTLDAAPDLQVTITDGVTSRAPGDARDYTITATNVGNQVATGTTVTVVLPPGVQPVLSGASTTAGATYDPATRTVTFPVGPLSPADGPTTLALTTTVDDPLGAGISSLPVTATVADDGTNGPDPTPAGNTATDTDDTTGYVDVSVVKDDFTTVARPGDTLTYTVTVTNSGTQSTSGATVTDTLPAGTTFVSATPAPTTVTGSPAVLTWTGQSVTGGVGSTVYVVRAKVSLPQPAGRTQLTNTARVSDPGEAPAQVDTGNTGTDTDQLDAYPDLVVTLSDSRAVVAAGDTLTYVATITNIGNQDSADTFLRIEGSTGAPVTDCHSGYALIGSNGCGYVIGAVPGGGGSVTVLMSVAVDNPLAAEVRGLVATATVSDPAEPAARVDAQNSATDTDTVGAETEPDLTVTKDDGQSVVTPGQALTYTLTVTNTGTRDATGVVVTDVLPAQLSYAASRPGVSYDPATRTLTWAVGGITGRGGSQTLALPLQVAATVPAGLTSITNTATVDDGPGGDDPGPNATASDTDTVSATPDLVVTKDDGVTSLRAGQDVTYTITVRNAGTQGATTVQVTDVLPDTLTLLSVAASPGTASEPTPGTARLDVPELAAGSSATLTVTARVVDPLPAGTASIVNTVTGSDDGDNGSDPTPGNNSASDTDRVGADLSVTKTDGRTAVRAGERVVWTVTVSNAGPDTVTAVDVTETLPPGLTDVVITPSTGSYVGGAWTGLDLRAGQSITLQVAGRTDPAAVRGTLTNTVSVTPVGSGDPTPGDATASDTDTVDPAADLSVTKTHPGTAEVGGTLDYVLVAASAGPSQAEGPITLTDVLPTGLTPTGATGDGWTCTVEAQQVRCSAPGPLAPGEKLAAVTVSTQVGPAAEPGVTNSVTVASTTPDPDPSNNTARDPAPVGAVSDLTVDKQLSGSLQSGGEARYLLVVTNRGPSVTRGPVTVTDPLPEGLSGERAEGPGWQCEVDPRVVRCVSTDPLSVDQAAAPIELVATVTAAPGATVTNTASVTGPARDPQPADNAGSATAVVAPGPVLPEQPESPSEGGLRSSGRESGPLPYTGARGLLPLALLGGLCTVVGAGLLRRRR